MFAFWGSVGYYLAVSKHTSTPQLLSSLLISFIFVSSPLVARADNINPPDAPGPLVTAPLLISEVQTGTTASASEEFIELYNTTPQTIDFSAFQWQLQVASSSATTWENPFRTINLAGSVPAGGSYIVASSYSKDGQAVQYLADKAGGWFSAGLSATAGHIRLIYTTSRPGLDGSCQPTPTLVDEVEWGVSSGTIPTASLDSRSLYLSGSSTGISKTQSLQRALLNGYYSDTNDDAIDFAVATPTPGNRGGAGDDGTGAVRDVDRRRREVAGRAGLRRVRGRRGEPGLQHAPGPVLGLR